jgi:uncharacterized protein YidB (DUF937 family)
MSFLKGLMEKILSKDTATAPLTEHEGLLDSVAGMIRSGGLTSVLEGFKKEGLGGAVQSWIGTGPNQPVSGEQVESALGEEKIEEIAQKAGLSKDETAGGLAQLLPQLVDRLTPGGKLPEAGGLASMVGAIMASLGGKAASRPPEEEP